MNARARTDITEPHPKATAVFTCVLGGLAGLMFGLDIGVISGAQHFIQQDFRISDHGARIDRQLDDAGCSRWRDRAGWMSASLGRKRSLMVGRLVFVLASVLCGVAWSRDSADRAR